MNPNLPSISDVIVVITLLKLTTFIHIYENTQLLKQHMTDVYNLKNKIEMKRIVSSTSDCHPDPFSFKLPHLH